MKNSLRNRSPVGYFHQKTTVTGSIQKPALSLSHAHRGKINFLAAEKRCNTLAELSLVGVNFEWKACCTLVIRYDLYARLEAVYRYDALGRRVWVRTRNDCKDAGGHLGRCAVGTLRRIVWDGDSELYEIAVPVSSDNALVRHRIRYVRGGERYRVGAPARAVGRLRPAAAVGARRLHLRPRDRQAHQRDSNELRGSSDWPDLTTDGMSRSRSSPTGTCAARHKRGRTPTARASAAWTRRGPGAWRWTGRRGGSRTVPRGRFRNTGMARCSTRSGTPPDCSTAATDTTTRPPAASPRKIPSGWRLGSTCMGTLVGTRSTTRILSGSVVSLAG